MISAISPSTAVPPRPTSRSVTRPSVGFDASPDTRAVAAELYQLLVADLPERAACGKVKHRLDKIGFSLRVSPCHHVDAIREHSRHAVVVAKTVEKYFLNDHIFVSAVLIISDYPHILRNRPA
jgi:hypothetical protein